MTLLHSDEIRAGTVKFETRPAPNGDGYELLTFYQHIYISEWVPNLDDLVCLMEATLRSAYNQATAHPVEVDKLARSKP